jgi:hypothetical protein
MSSDREDALREARAQIVSAIEELRAIGVRVPMSLHRAAHALSHATPLPPNAWRAEGDELGMIWWSALSEQERAVWSRNADSTGCAKDAWEAFKRAAPREDLPAVRPMGQS